MPLTIINWNVQWAGSRSPRGSEFLRRSLTHSPEIICFTEANTSLQAEAGHVISSEPNYGYPIKESSPPCPLLQSIFQTLAKDHPSVLAVKAVNQPHVPDQ